MAADSPYNPKGYVTASSPIWSYTPLSAPAAGPLAPVSSVFGEREEMLRTMEQTKLILLTFKLPVPQNDAEGGSTLVGQALGQAKMDVYEAVMRKPTLWRFLLGKRGGTGGCCGVDGL